MKFFIFTLLSIWSFSGFAALLQIGPQIIEVEIADTKESRDRGLMFRDKLADGHGMLFVYKEARILSFWMKNTFIPLSIAFFDKEYTLLEIKDMPPCTQEPALPHFTSSSPALYALEVPKGWFERHNIRPGMKFSFLDQPK